MFLCLTSIPVVLKVLFAFLLFLPCFRWSSCCVALCCLLSFSFVWFCSVLFVYGLLGLYTETSGYFGCSFVLHFLVPSILTCLVSFWGNQTSPKHRAAP